MNSPVYESPSIVRHQMGAMNKFGRLQGVRPLTHIDGVAIADLVAEHGSPLFVFSQRTLVNRYRELHGAFARRWAKVRIAWSYKTNYLEAICRTFHREGAWAEVVSPFEYDKAILAGVPAERIHWNGPYKPDAALARAVSGGSIIHIDNLDELARIERVAERVKARPKVAIRVNMNIEGLAPWSRFGLNLESGQAREAVSRLVSGDRMELTGLHCHIGTFILDPGAYGKAASKLARLANEIRAAHGIRLSFLDLGGGFASKNTLKAQYLLGEQASPSFERYAEAICDGLGELDCPARELPTLVLETGRALVDDAGYLIATVEAKKRLPDGRSGLVLDAGVNLLFTSFWYKHDVVPAQEFSAMQEPTVMFGPLCMNIDVVRDTMQFPASSPGDRLVFRNVGAYNVTQWHQFITLRPAVVMVGEGGASCIRRAETLDDFRAVEDVPAWLR
ncbi:diaminopimelate decarboxylase [Sorangium sp. So ce381]|uniref:diaminopimelate decarboxylase n=1 Tax=Sorangium sp. So ce381 TaxID=3133307 RepID=UPI003F5BBAF1